MQQARCGEELCSLGSHGYWLPVRGEREPNWAQGETSGTAILSSADSILLFPEPSTTPSQLWKPCDFVNHRIGLIGILVVCSVRVFVGVWPGPSWQAIACHPALPLPSPFYKLRASYFLELLQFPRVRGAGNRMFPGWPIWKEAAAYVEPVL